MGTAVLTDSRTKRAFDYLRVSGGPRQTKTDYDPEGLSIGAQREAALDKALQLDADIVREFSDPGKSAYVAFPLELTARPSLAVLSRALLSFAGGS